MTREGLAAGRARIGRLWPWQATHDPEPPMLYNHDGQQVVFHDATFDVADRTALDAALAARDDVDVTGFSVDQWNWFRIGDDGSTTLLGLLEIDDDELSLQVNSDERLSLARSWLDPIPGVAFDGVDTKRINLDIAQAVYFPHDVVFDPRFDELVRRYPERYREWIDRPNPSLGDRSPRELCDTEAGKRRVRRMVLCIAADQRSDVVPPREMMLRELGI